MRYLDVLAFMFPLWSVDKDLMDEKSNEIKKYQVIWINLDLFALLGDKGLMD